MSERNEYEDASGTTREGATVDEGGAYLDEGGYDESHEREDPGSGIWSLTLIGTVLVVGVALFFFPEPATSMLGVVLIALAVIAWVAHAVR